jgi:CRISPR-associated endonuclease/helicase Cas3
MSLDIFYKKTFSDEFEPYDYQLKVAHSLIREGKNIILQVPTGAGKTWASIMPFLYAKKLGLDSFPNKMIYSLPLRTLANSIYEDVIKVTDASIQTGEYSDDPYFEKDIIFSTIDQTLSNFLCFPLPLSPRQANINAGALIGSYLVFDEFHLLDTDRAMSTTIGTLEILDNLCRFCIMTATLSDGFIEELKNNSKLKNVEVITLKQNDLDKIQSLLPKENKKKVSVMPTPIDAQKIIEKHINQKEKRNKSFVICNRIENAQRVYLELIEEQIKSNDPIFKEAEIICLHSRFYDADRKKIESKLKTLFGKKSSNSINAILIATTVIEAGMDISCAILHTEVSPISSFLQRAGRNARFGGETGEIFIYPLLTVAEKEMVKFEPENEDDRNEIRQINSKYLPYNEKDCEAVYTAIQQYETLDGNIPKRLIEEIIGQSEKEQLIAQRAGGFNKSKIVESWKLCKKNMYRETIRDIQSVEVVLVDEKRLNEAEKYPFAYQSVGIFKWSLVSWLGKIKDSKGARPFEDGDQLAWNLIEKKDDNIIDFENDEDLKYKLNPVNDFKMLDNRIYLNAKYFGYSNEFGLSWEYAQFFGNQSPQKSWKEEKIKMKALEKDTYFEHNMGLLGVFQKEFLGEGNDKLDFTFKALTQYLELEAFSKSDFIKVMRWMIVLHDYGKLNETWQKPMQEYQLRKTGTKTNEILAHTYYNSNLDVDVKLLKEVEKEIGKRPSHASIGAFTFQEMIEEFFENPFLKTCISVAIAKHHSADITKAIEVPKFEIKETSYQEAQTLLKKYGLNTTLKKSNAYRVENLDDFEGGGEYEKHIAYLFFVRILRLCDQKATDDFRKYLPYVL